MEFLVKSAMKRTLLSIAMFAMGSSARAADEDKLNERVSASACQPQSSGARPLIAWSGTDWQFESGEVGTVVLECPVFTPFEDEETGTR